MGWLLCMVHAFRRLIDKCVANVTLGTLATSSFFGLHNTTARSPRSVALAPKSCAGDGAAAAEEIGAAAMGCGTSQYEKDQEAAIRRSCDKTQMARLKKKVPPAGTPPRVDPCGAGQLYEIPV